MVKTRKVYDDAIFELQREVRKVQAAIREIDDKEKEFEAEEAAKKSWTTWMLRPIYGKQVETEEERETKSRERLGRIHSKYIRERELDRKEQDLKRWEERLRVQEMEREAADHKHDVDRMVLEEAILRKNEKAKKERERVEREAQEKAQRERMEKERIEREATAKAWRETIEKERKESEARERAWREQREKERRELEARQRALREQQEKEWKERQERYAAQQRKMEGMTRDELARQQAKIREEAKRRREEGNPRSWGYRNGEMRGMSNTQPNPSELFRQLDPRSVLGQPVLTTSGGIKPRVAQVVRAVECFGTTISCNALAVM